ncbi:spore germination protein GerPC [Paenibacillus crassostreae]|uniref:Uncharacterized protein n=1 Tax=Paenibacillus crassostreae TaxID=1763538 RepID=A0A167DV24_9BACL|nr:spore germination protein GerPC [Paenibacillus crassostreae]AOZ91027.1 hypothetical protein LPB68_01625 [Paenibacillus crassostreae]OAB74811.1 hypothetical protein PNBC_12330 [Paenibacillus crassostreae]
MHPYYVQQLFNELRMQSDKIQQLEKRYGELQSEIEHLKNKKSANIGPINYHFEQLKIEKLEGTLNIGINPNEGNNFEEVMVNGQPIGTNEAENKALYEKIHPTVKQYVQEEVPKQLAYLASERNLNMNPQFIHMVTQDLQQQMDGRINEYLGQMPKLKERSETDEEVCNSIIKQIQVDIDIAVKRHMEFNINEG